MSNIDKYKEDIIKLIEKGDELLNLLKDTDEKLLSFREEYECWYSEALYLIKIILSDRLVDFQNYYDNKKGDSLKKAITYTAPIREELEVGFGYLPPKQIDIAKSLFINQLNIVKSAQNKFESSLFQLKEVLQVDLFDSELEAARELNKKGFMRGAGAIAGVVLEKHLYSVSVNHNLKILKKNPTINDYNQVLKDGDVIEVHDWRFIQHLGDLRNFCDHNKGKEPSKVQVEELIVGVEKISKSIF